MRGRKHMQGYIKINRAILYHPSLQKKDRALCEIGAFIWILLEASFKDRNFDINGQTIKLKRGQLCCSISYMAKAFNWNRAKVQRFLDRLKSNGTITTDTPNDTPIDNKQNKLIRINDKNVDDFIYIWGKLRAKRGSKKLALQKYNKIKHKVNKDTLIEKYNKLVKSASSIEFVPHFSTFLSQERWLDEDEVVKEKAITPEQFFRKRFPNTIPDGYLMVAHSWNEITFSNGKQQITYDYKTGEQI